MKCTSCKTGTMQPATAKHEETIAGCKFTATLPGASCSACGEGKLRKTDRDAFDLAVAKSLVLSEATPEKFIFVRKALGYKAKDLAELLGTTPESVSRWENGKHNIDRQSWALLALLTMNQGPVEQFLKDLSEPVKLGKTVAL